jgi:hypothetical protein
MKPGGFELWISQLDSTCAGPPPRPATIAGSRKQKTTLVKRNTSMRVSALWWKMASHVPGVAATLKHTQSDSSASEDR